MFTVLDIKLDFTQFPHFDTQDQEYANGVKGEYDAIDVLNVVHRVEELFFKFPVLEAIISYNGQNVYVNKTV